MKLEVGMYVRGKYYSYRGKIGKIIKNYKGDLEIAYKDGLLKTTVNSFIEDNYDIHGKQYIASHNIIDLIEAGDYVNGYIVVQIDDFSNSYKCVYVDRDTNMGFRTISFKEEDIKSIVTKEQFESMEYKI